MLLSDHFGASTTISCTIGNHLQIYFTKGSIARRYTIEVITNGDNKATDVILREKQDRIDEPKTLYGAYVIETNRNDLESEEIWRLYMTLTKVEGAFRALKSDLGLRPEPRRTRLLLLTTCVVSLLRWGLPQFHAAAGRVQRTLMPCRVSHGFAVGGATPGGFRSSQRRFAV